MDTVTALWVVVFFLFSLVMIFVWSKIRIITRKIRNIEAVFLRVRELDADEQSGGA
jgi:hypothetical protein